MPCCGFYHAGFGYYVKIFFRLFSKLDLSYNYLVSFLFYWISFYHFKKKKNLWSICSLSDLFSFGLFRLTQSTPKRQLATQNVQFTTTYMQSIFIMLSFENSHKQRDQISPPSETLNHFLSLNMKLVCIWITCLR